MNILNLVVPSAVLIQQKFSTKKIALKALSHRAATLSGLDKASILYELEAREKLGSTGMGGGVAVPHCKMPTLGRSFALFLVLEKSIDFAAIDKQPVDLVCLLVSPVDQPAEHLRALACVSRLLRDRALCAQLRGCRDADAIYTLLAQNSVQKAA